VVDAEKEEEPNEKASIKKDTAAENQRVNTKRIEKRELIGEDNYL